MTEPEMGQMLFGNKWEEIPAPDFVARGLYDLSERLGRMNPDEQSHGVFGGEFGYGQDFDNDVFEMHPYWWGECECGHEQRQYEWERANKHEESCYQTELDLARRHDGIRTYSDDEPYKPSTLSFDEERKREEVIYKTLTAKHGLTYPNGCAVHCTCSWTKRWEEFNATYDHAERCRTVLPNFIHKPSGYRVHWYKYIGRSTTANREVSWEEFDSILGACRSSLSGLQDGSAPK